MVELLRGPGSITMPTSKTQQLIDWISAEISSGRLKVGDKLPSAAELRAQHDVSITVVREATNYLKATGVLEGVPGVGVYVKAKPNG